MPYKPPKIEKIQYQIGEVADMFGVNVSRIRFWENEFDILKPHKDGKGTRYFKPKDIDNLHLIFHLIDERGMTLEGVKKKLKDQREQTLKNFEIVKRLSILRAELLTLREVLDESSNDHYNT